MFLRNGWARFFVIVAAFCAMSTSEVFAQTVAPVDRSAKSALDGILARKLIRVAVQKDFAPFSIPGTGGLKGYDISVAKMLAVDLGVRLEIVPVAGPERIPMLQQGKVDVIIASLGKNAEREKQIDFSNAYAPFFLAVFGPKADVVSGPQDFNDGRIGVTKASIEEGELAKLKVPAINIVVFPDNKATLEAFRAGKVRFIAAGNSTVAQLSLEEASRVGMKLLLRDSPCFIGLPKGETALQLRLNEFITRAKSYSYLQSNVQQWFKFALPDNML
jgi:polar amino acid transport system substrate-binding protein